MLLFDVILEYLMKMNVYKIHLNTSDHFIMISL